MQNKISKKNLIIGVSIIGIISIIFIFSKTCSSSDGDEYIFEKATYGRVKHSINVTGVLEVIDTKRVLSKINGVVNKVYVDFNQTIRRGQLLATLDSTEIDTKIIRAQTRFEKAKLELLIAEENRNVKKSLYKDKLIARKEMDKANLDFKKVLFEYKQVKQEYNLAQRQKNYTRITSPINGFVISRDIEDSTPITISKNLFTIAPSLRSMRLIINIDESDIGIIKKGQTVTFMVSAFPEQKFKGSIKQVRINPIQKKGLVSYQSIALAKNEKLFLKPGMTATATIIVSNKARALRVSKNAFLVMPYDIVVDTDKKILWVKDENSSNELKKVEVEVGVKGDLYYEITKNVKEGDEVLLRVIKYKE